MLEMEDGDEVDAEVPNNLITGLDELPSWHDGFLPHSCRLGASVLRLESRLSVLPLVGLWDPYRPTNLRGCSPGSFSLSFPFACA